ncbi:DUF1904 domain-containing protein [Paenibacillus sp. N1-5-1-14]|uniref:DUF1904 domain-containing protein n=1 Tax=Paenibacillus radicibacter TaxID=2972488 RepID=UPI0021599518|nr:DUF1904 domain-containing protein [Paenibacillus radicibacter]MCR8642698.1 DUF1904 domain-containing protein [Paenibacillus radicibacter]
MPQLIVRGVTPEQMCTISTPLVKELAELCECDNDNFMIECIHTTSVFGGNVVETYPFIEVAWFERGKEVRDKFADIVTKHVRSLDIPEVEVAFTVFQENSYYINGESCSDEE